MIRLDEERGDVIDWDFVNERTVGFTPETMPEDAATDENYRDYILGAYDGTPKTPEWASEICGTPVEDITWYAELAAKDNKVIFFHSYAASRYLGAENLPQAFMTVSALGGHYGKSGHGSIRATASSSMRAASTPTSTTWWARRERPAPTAVSKATRGGARWQRGSTCPRPRALTT